MKGSLTACEAMPWEQPQVGTQPLRGYHQLHSISRALPGAVTKNPALQATTLRATTLQPQQGWTQAQGLWPVCSLRSPLHCYF